MLSQFVQEALLCLVKAYVHGVLISTCYAFGQLESAIQAGLSGIARQWDWFQQPRTCWCFSLDVSIASWKLPECIPDSRFIHSSNFLTISVARSTKACCPVVASQMRKPMSAWRSSWHAACGDVCPFASFLAFWMMQKIPKIFLLGFTLQIYC